MIRTIALAAALLGTTSQALASQKPTIVLVHGAFADGTGWSRVIPVLQRQGYNVIAVQNPLTSFTVDVETTRRVIDAQAGPIVLVGHSYGGAVITEAAAGRKNVKALVFIAAFAPEAGEPIGAYLEKYPTPLGQALRPDAAGFVQVAPERFAEIFAADLPREEAMVASAAQKPIIGTAFGERVTAASWKSIPSWYLVAQQDLAIHPDLERFYARRMGAKTVEVKASHAVFLSRPNDVVRLVAQAAASISQK
jgi:pimeloyl-ACP methyl ester carboxylesterase